MTAKKRKLPWFNVAIAAIACTFWIVSGSVTSRYWMRFDFLSLYLGGAVLRQAGPSHLYALELQRQVETIILPNVGFFVPFCRPPIYALAVSPLAVLSLFPAYWTWLGLQAVVLLGCWAWAVRKFGSDALVYCSFYLPSAWGLIHGQDNVWILLIFIGFFLLAEQARNFAAGAVLGIALVKFNLLWFFPVAMILQKRWRMLFGLSVAGFVHALASVWLVGVNGL